MWWGVKRTEECKDTLNGGDQVPVGLNILYHDKEEHGNKSLSTGRGNKKNTQEMSCGRGSKRPKMLKLSWLDRGQSFCWLAVCIWIPFAEFCAFLTHSTKNNEIAFYLLSCESLCWRVIAQTVWMCPADREYQKGVEIYIMSVSWQRKM